MGGTGALMGNSTLKSTLSISRHAKALCLGVKLCSRAPTCSPNEPASSRSDASLEIWRIAPRQNRCWTPVSSFAFVEYLMMVKVFLR